MLISLIFHEPSAYLIEYTMEMEKRYPGLNLSISHLSKILKEREINKKQVNILPS